jgi:hypothetical protein
LSHARNVTHRDRGMNFNVYSGLFSVLFLKGRNRVAASFQLFGTVSVCYGIACVALTRIKVLFCSNLKNEHCSQCNGIRYVLIPINCFKQQAFS